MVESIQYTFYKKIKVKTKNNFLWDFFYIYSNKKENAFPAKMADKYANRV